MNVTQFKERLLPLSRLLYAAAWRLTGNDADAEDLVQETYLKLWTKLDKIGNTENLAAYTTATMRNIHIDSTRRQHLQTIGKAADELAIRSDDDVGRSTEAHDSQAKIIGLIAQLPDSMRTVITMKDIDGMTMEEIAQHTGMSQVNVRVTLSRARMKIREQYLKMERRKRQ